MKLTRTTVPERNAEPAPDAVLVKARTEPRWPVAALVAALAVNGLWVALLLYLIAHWVGVV
jgi:hypothetical protein